MACWTQGITKPLFITVWFNASHWKMHKWNEVGVHKYLLVKVIIKFPGHAHKVDPSSKSWEKLARVSGFSNRNGLAGMVRNVCSAGWGGSAKAKAILCQGTRKLGRAPTFVTHPSMLSTKSGSQKHYDWPGHVLYVMYSYQNVKIIRDQSSHVFTICGQTCCLNGLTPWCQAS